MPDDWEEEKRRILARKCMKQYDFNEHMENYNVETTALHRKLQSKTDALRIMRQELERFRTERDQFKLMAETLQLRYAALTRHNVYAASDVSSSTSVANLLRETRERNIKLTTEVEMLKQKVQDLQGDIKVLRDTGSRMGVQRSHNSCQVHTNDEKLWKAERSKLITQLENLKKKNAQMAFDMRTLCDEKQELIMERDAYKCKAHRLNHELRNALKANEKYPKLLDIDGIVLENKFLHECLKNTENELELTKQDVAKYKNLTENKKKKGFMRQDKMNDQVDFANILSHKQIKSMLESGVELPLHTETVQDLKKLSLILLDTLNDKNLALNHQKKANKMLALKITELERKMYLLLGEEAGLSPSETLLNMYSPASETSTSQHPETTSASDSASAENALPMNPNKVNELSNGDPNLELISEAEEVAKSSQVESSHSDDEISMSNSESAHSVTSSEYSVCEATKIVPKDVIYACDTPSKKSCENKYVYQKHFSIPNSIMQERIEDLKDLPPDLANLVKQALYELDKRDFEVGNICVATTLTHNKAGKKHNKSNKIAIDIDTYALEESTA